MVCMKQLSQWYSVGLMYVRMQSDGDLPTKKERQSTGLEGLWKNRTLLNSLKGKMLFYDF